MKPASAKTIDEALQDNPFFRRGVADIIANSLSAIFQTPTLSQAKAFKLFGRNRVQAWVAKGWLQERRRDSGKRVDYFTADLLEAQRKSVYL